MTWNTESISTMAKSKKDGDHTHGRKRYSIISRRPSARRRVPLSRSRHYTTSAALQKKSSLDVECSNSLDKTVEEKRDKSDVSKEDLHAKKAVHKPSSDSSMPPGNQRVHPDSHSDASISKTLTDPAQTTSNPPSRDLSPEISVVCEDTGPKVSIVKDSYVGHGSRVQRSWKKDMRLEMPTVQDACDSERGKHCLSDSGLPDEADHCVLCAEVCREKRKPSTEADISVSRSETSRVVRRRLLRRSISVRNRTKFSRRKPLSPAATCTRQNEAESEVEKADVDSEVVFLEDIKIDLQEDDLVDKQTEHAGTNIITTTEEDTDKRQQQLQQKTWRSAHTLARKRRCKKIRVRLCRRPRKIVIIGDMTSGKTNLISAYGQDRFTENYVPTILACHQTDARIGGEVIDLVVVEISGRDDFEPLRRRAYRRMDGAVICYSVDSMTSLNRVRDYWVPELRRHAPKAPFVLVGTKRDLRDEARDKLEERLAASRQREGVSDADGMAERLGAEAQFREEFVSEDRGKRMAESLGANGFVECSSLYRDRTRQVFECMTSVALKKSRRKRSSRRHVDGMCTVM